MNIEQVENFSISFLESKLNLWGFRRKKTLKFVRKTTVGFDEIFFHYSDYEPNFYFSYGFSKRIDIKEEISNLYNHEIFNAKEFGKESGIGILPDNIAQNQMQAIPISSLDNLQSELTKFLKLIENEIIPKFDSFNDIKMLDKEMNKPDTFGHWKNIIIAKLANNPEYENLVEKYRKQLEEVADNIHYKAYLPIYEKVVAHLKSI